MSNSIGNWTPETLQQGAAPESHPPREPYQPTPSYTEPNPNDPKPTDMQLVSRTGAFRMYPEEWDANGKAVGEEAQRCFNAVANTPRQRPDGGLHTPQEYCELVQSTYQRLYSEVE